MAELIGEHDAQESAIEQRERERRLRGATLRELAPEWLEYLEREKGAKPSTLRDYRSRINSRLPATLTLPISCNCPAEIFRTDMTGDGSGGDVLPGTNLGSYGRSISSPSKLNHGRRTSIHKGPMRYTVPGNGSDYGQCYKSPTNAFTSLGNTWPMSRVLWREP